MSLLPINMAGNFDAAVCPDTVVRSSLSPTAPLMRPAVAADAVGVIYMIVLASRVSHGEPITVTKLLR